MATVLSHLPPLLPSKLPATNNYSFIFPNTLPNRFKCSAGGTCFFTKLGRLIREKAKSDVDKFSGFLETLENLAVIDELLLYWNLSDPLEEAWLVSDFGPKITIKICGELERRYVCWKTQNRK